jgi:uncharacterized protein (DUF1800 family)
MELFALGVGAPNDPNYSEQDIKEATRAFTGYTINAAGNWELNSGNHDSGIKTVLGQQCESGDQVHHILLTATKNGRNISAYYLTAKLWSWFAYPVTVDDPIVARLAPGFEQTGHNVAWLLSQLFRQPEFSSNAAYRALIKSPVEVAVGILRLLSAERVPNSNVLNRLSEQGMRLFHPPDVAGWPSGASWINASTVLSRCNMAAAIVNSLGRTGVNDAGGPPVAGHIAGITDNAAKVDTILAMLVDGNVNASTRGSLITYAQTATTDERIRGLFNLVLALPAFQLN